MRALNDGRAQWTTADHLTADLWALWSKQLLGVAKDHPVRAEMEAKARAEAKQAKVAKMMDRFENRKRAYGLG